MTTATWLNHICETPMWWRMMMASRGACRREALADTVWRPHLLHLSRHLPAPWRSLARPLDVPVVQAASPATRLDEPEVIAPFGRRCCGELASADEKEEAGAPARHRLRAPTVVGAWHRGHATQRRTRRMPLAPVSHDCRCRERRRRTRRRVYGEKGERGELVRTRRTRSRWIDKIGAVSNWGETAYNFLTRIGGTCGWEAPSIRFLQSVRMIEP